MSTPFVPGKGYKRRKPGIVISGSGAYLLAGSRLERGEIDAALERFRAAVAKRLPDGRRTTSGYVDVFVTIKRGAEYVVVEGAGREETLLALRDAAKECGFELA